MDRNLKLGIDVDGVLADFVMGHVKALQHVTGKNLFPADFVETEWDYHLAVGYTQEEDARTWKYIADSPDFWRTLPPLSSAEASLNYLRKKWVEGCDVYFITTRFGERVKEQTEDWLDTFNEKIPHGVPNPTVLITRRKGLCCKALNIDLFIDDKPENCMDVVMHSPATKVFLLNQPWNAAWTNKTPWITRRDALVGFADGE